eukprot:TRINITY_DN1767_c0_g1::TRINITY_DN1767_c0_g1_i1::g.25239::m.25239 TRINITY_DN1767_c0_g1::TRINITY_DN1767_c0_g1_i1::g.25239  ORF type:complete len:306 (+),score=44.48,sp/Q99297/ODC2_YEAST/44.95/5e-77,Mito_carr/PF00153.22/1.4e-27,Mito_carr/PF00153.22/1.1e-17,Mito_carr/PF00153.22/8.1e-20 TRINITY_DN1767_c0_g1_i1:53-919(+)
MAPSGHGDLPFWKHVVAGGSAGLVEILVMYPLDVVKTRLQLQVAGSADSYNSVGDALRKIYRSQGIAGFYRGIESPILGEVPKRALKFSSNEAYKKWLGNMSGAAVLAGAGAGVTEAFINVPFEVTKVRMQSKDNLGRYKSTGHCASEILKNEGMKGLFRGIEVQAVRNAVWNGAYFGIIPFVNRNMPAPGDSKTKATFNKFVAGLLGGSIATCMNTPLDVVKSRQQNALPGSAIEAKYKNPYKSLVIIYREEGTKSLWKGLTPRLMRLGPGGGIMIVAFDFVVGLLA